MASMGRLASAGFAFAGLTICAGSALAQAATGLVECGGALATGQLTGSADRITTAAHALYDEAGHSRARYGRCVFRVMVGGMMREFPIRPGAAIGSRSPYAIAGGGHDWAVARLAVPVPGATPYRLGGAARVGDRVMLAGAHGRSRLCRVTAVGGAGRGGREIRTDCDTHTGDSGAAYVTTDNRVVGVHVGVRRAGFGTAHTFGVAVEGAFRGAASH